MLLPPIREHSELFLMISRRRNLANFASTTAFNNASFATESLDNYLAGLRSGPNGTFIGGNGSIDAGRD